MRRLRGFLSGYLALVALSALVTERGSKRASGLLGTVSSIINRALSPGVAAIPDYSAGGGGGGSDSTLTGTGKSPNPDAPQGKSSTIIPGNRPLVGSYAASREQGTTYPVPNVGGIPVTLPHI